MKKTFAVVLLTWFVAACGGSSPTSPSDSIASASMAGTWAGTGSDSSGSMGAGSMMGQTDMRTMTWQLTQNGSTVTGPMSFSGSDLQGRMPGSFLGTLSGDDMTFTMDMPSSGMMSSGCSSRATGPCAIGWPNPRSVASERAAISSARRRRSGGSAPIKQLYGCTRQVLPVCSRATDC